jgi:hypothetical protein
VPSGLAQSKVLLRGSVSPLGSTRRMVMFWNSPRYVSSGMSAGVLNPTVISEFNKFRGESEVGWMRRWKMVAQQR